MKVIELENKVDEYSIKSLFRNKPIDVEVDTLWTAYKVEEYSGYGHAVYLDTNGDWHYDDLGHCSCYGPFDGGWNGITYTKEEVIELLNKESLLGVSDSLLADKLMKEIKQWVFQY